MEEFYDMLLFIGILLGTLAFFICFWQESFQKQIVRMVVSDFLNQVATNGSISLEDYEGFLHQVSKINRNYKVELTYHGVIEEPCYALLSKEELEQYYLSRNVREECSLPLYEQEQEVISEEWKLQKETNSSILAAGGEQYIPLPESGGALEVEAVRKQQRVYEGEELITLCFVQTEQGAAYVEAEPIRAEESGVVELVILLGDVITCAKVEVLCYPRQRVCAEGHMYRNTEEMILTEEGGGEVICPICSIVPVEIVCNCQTLLQKVGEEFLPERVWLTAKFMDGTEEKITPESEEWLDDFDKNFCGLQLVTVQYRGVQTQLVVVTEGKLCLNCGAVCGGRYYADYIQFPYCAECMSKVALFTGEVFTTEYKKNAEEIVADMDSTGQFVMKRDDYLTVLIKKGEIYSMAQQCRIKKNEGGT